jgi:flagellar capping protein FliD
LETFFVMLDGFTSHLLESKKNKIHLLKHKKKTLTWKKKMFGTVRYIKEKLNKYQIDRVLGENIT